MPTSPTPPLMNAKEQAAYDAALHTIQVCRRQGKKGTALDLIGMGLTALPPEIGQLSALTRLSLHNNQITNLPPEIGQLFALTELYLSNNQITALPPQIGQLSALTRLFLDSNKLTALPPEIGQLSALPELYLSNNQLTALPPQIGQLSALTRLFLDSNKLTALPPEIGQLSALTELYLSNNQITTLPPQIGQLSSLNKLYLYNDQLTALPPEIGQLSALTELYLSNNQLTALPPEISRLSALKELYLHDNPQLGIPLSILGPTLAQVYTRDEKKAKPPARPADILTFYFSRGRDSRQRVGELKVMLVGRGGAGKTSLRRFFLNEPHDTSEKETPGIALDDFPLRCGQQEIRVRLWDFAGQEITHALHQFFLTEGSVYLLVLDPRSNTEMRDALYWLELLKRYARGAPVIVVLNRQDARPGGYDVDRQLLQQQFPVIAGFAATNCATRTGCDDLMKQLCTVIEALHPMQPPHLIVSATWLKVKDECFDAGQVREEKPGAVARWQSPAKHATPAVPRRQHLTLEEFRAICTRHGEHNSLWQESLARLLHQLGAVLHFADDPRLRDTAVLSPHWVTDAVYRLLRCKEGPHSDGILSLDAAREALPGETEKTVRYLLRLMERFDMCYPLDEEQDRPSTRWLVPGALGEFQPAGLPTEFQHAEAVRLRYVYDPLPEGVIPRFIVLSHLLCLGPLWRYGAVLSQGEASALVCRNANFLEIIALGPPADRLRLLEIIQGHLDRINATVPAPAPYAELELADLRGVYHKIENLKAAELLGNQVSLSVPQGQAQVQPSPQLDLTTERESRSPARLPLALYLGYSHKDKKARDIFKDNLAAMTTRRVISTWHDGLIEPDTLWRENIQDCLGTVDIFVGLLTNAFIHSGAVAEFEKAAIALRDKGRDCLFLLLLVDDVPLAGLDFPNCKKITPDGRAVSQHASRPKGFNRAQHELETLILQCQERHQARSRSGYVGADRSHRGSEPRTQSHTTAAGVTLIVHGDFKGDIIQRDKSIMNPIQSTIHGDNYGIIGHNNEQHIENSFNPRTDERSAQLERLFETLQAQAETLADVMLGKDSKIMRHHIAALEEAARKPAPDRARMLACGRNVIDATHTVAAHAGPVIATTGQILKVWDVSLP